MDIEVVFSAVLVISLGLILFMYWLHAWGRCDERFAEDIAEHETLSSSVEVDDQDLDEKAASRRGLDRAVVEALPIFVYGSSNSDELMESGTPCRECPVCLSEFQDQDRGRLLPNCRHRFHVECIDTWLLGNGTCPVCRASCVVRELALQVEAEAKAEAMTSAPTVGGVGGAGAVQYPTNVLFWGSNSVLVSSGSVRNITIQIITPRPPPLPPLDAAPSASLSTPPNSSRISRLNPLRRLLSRERMPSASTSLSKL